MIIWDANRSCNFLGFSSRTEGCLDPVYGFRWKSLGGRRQRYVFRLLRSRSRPIAKGDTWSKPTPMTEESSCVLGIQKIFLAWPCLSVMPFASSVWWTVSCPASCTRDQQTWAWVCPSTLPNIPCSFMIAHITAWSQVTLYTLCHRHTFFWITLNCWKCSFIENQGLSQSSKSFQSW